MDAGSEPRDGWDEGRLYAALLERDESFEGRAWVGVTTTGIFCRLSCPARKPKRENTRFFPSIEGCMQAGFRPCLRCRPLDAMGGTEPLVAKLLEALLAEPERRWTEADLQALGHDPSTVRRAFQRQFRTTFLGFARTVRLSRAGVDLKEGARVIDAQLSAGFESGSGFREAFAKKLGFAPRDARADQALRADWVPTPLGPMLAVARAEGLCLLEFFDRRALPTELKRLQAQHGPLGIGRFESIHQVEAELKAFFSGESARFETPLAPSGTPFQTLVWRALRAIPAGQRTHYGRLAEQLGRPTASRAVARANGANVLALLIPCHRVVGADGSLVGYGGGPWRKRWLLEHERASFGSTSGSPLSAPEGALDPHPRP